MRERGGINNPQMTFPQKPILLEIKFESGFCDIVKYPSGYKTSLWSTYMLLPVFSYDVINWRQQVESAGLSGSLLKSVIKREVFKKIYWRNYYSQTTLSLSNNRATSNDVILQDGRLDRNCGSITFISRNNSKMKMMSAVIYLQFVHCNKTATAAPMIS